MTGQPTESHTIGWICPKCNNVYSPHTIQCIVCYKIPTPKPVVPYWAGDDGSPCLLRNTGHGSVDHSSAKGIACPCPLCSPRC